MAKTIRRPELRKKVARLRLERADAKLFPVLKKFPPERTTIHFGKIIRAIRGEISVENAEDSYKYLKAFKEEIGDATTEMVKAMRSNMRTGKNFSEQGTRQMAFMLAEMREADETLLHLLSMYEAKIKK